MSLPLSPSSFSSIIIKSSLVIGCWVGLNGANATAAEKRYTFDSLLSNWYEGENPLVEASNGELRLSPKVVNGISVNGAGTEEEFPTPSAGDWAGATWTAPDGEIISQVRVAGDFRRETLDFEDFGAGIYGGRATGASNDVEIILSAGGSDKEIGYAAWNPTTHKMSYDWSVSVNPSDAITQLQIRPWQAISGGVTIQSGSNPVGYSGNVASLEITTVPAVSKNTEAQRATLEEAKRNGIILGDDVTRLTLSQKGEVLALEDLKTATTIFSETVTPKAWTLAWRITPKGGEDISVSEGFESADAEKEDPTKEANGLLSSERYGPPVVKQAKDEVTFTWQAEGLPTVIGKVAFDPAAKQFAFTSTVENHSNLIVDHLSFPAKAYFKAVATSSVIVAADNEYNTSIKPLNTLQPFTTMYPGYMFMQLAAFQIGSSSLLAYTNDANAHVKWIRMTREGDSVGFDFSQQVRVKPGGKWAAPFSVVWKVVPNGTYHEMATAYAEWGRKQWWAKKTLKEKMSERPLLKRYFSAGLVRFDAGPPMCDSTSFHQSEDHRWHYIEGNVYAKYEPYYDTIVDFIGKYQQAYDFEPGYWFPVWSGHQFDSIYPDYLPVKSYMGDFNKFKADLIRNGYPMMYHMNPAQWSATAPSATEEKYLAVTDKGTQYKIWFQWSKQWSIIASPLLALEKDMITVNAIRDDAGVNGIYMDVIGHSFATDENPLSPFHGEPNDYQRQKIEVFKAFREGITGPIMTEARNEIELLYMDMGTGGNGGPDVDEVPLWELVYGDLTANTTYAVKDKRLSYYTWMIGGVNATTWTWPDADGKLLRIYLISIQQRVLFDIVSERMERFERLGDARLSVWASGFVLWNKALKGDASSYTQATRLGKIDVSDLSPGGIVMWNKANEFSVDGAKEVKIDGKTLFHRTDGSPLSISRAGGRWVIHNENETTVTTTIRAIAAPADPDQWSGKYITSGKALTADVKKDGEFVILNLEIPAGECLVLGLNRSVVGNPNRVEKN